ncbi:MAG TPA: penicillin-binding protein 2 [Spirochaetota bacterium]|nr:penicillin-binding protein 2 [Spirochaetota bacterium]
MSVTSLRGRMLEAFRGKVFLFMSVTGGIFIIFIFQLINLQFIQGSYYSTRARSNIEDNVPVPASRGEVYDRHFDIKSSSNKVIASNRPSFNITTVPAKFENKKQMAEIVQRVAVLLGVDSFELLREMDKANPWQRIVIKEDVSFDVVVSIASHEELYEHIMWEDAPVRVYNYGSVFSHVMGYIGSIDPGEYDKLKDQGYKYYQKIGKNGIEKQYDNFLRGTDGSVKRIVDVHNRTEGEELGDEPVSGNNLVLSLDYELQNVAYTAMQDKMGSVIAVKPSTGEILVLLSKPDFDPNLITSKNASDILASLQNNEQKPFLNRAIQSKYPPASTFKLITSIAALEDEKWQPDWRYFCSGHYILKGLQDRSYQCYKGQSHGNLDMIGAIGMSCNVYFYNLGYKIGPTSIINYAKYLCMDKVTGIDLPGEISGFVPSKQWKMKTFGQGWFDGDTINLAIGQGFTSITPVALCDLVSAIVNRGIVYKPHLVREVRSQDNATVIKRIEREKLFEIPLSARTIETVTSGMRFGVTNGTSARLNYLKVPIAAKTGTVQTRSVVKSDNTQHAWFVGFAPFGGTPDDSVVVVVMVEYGVAGAIAAVPVGEAIFSKMISMGYFNDTQK